MPPIGHSILSDLTRRLDRNRNNRLESFEARVRGWIGNMNGVAGTQETAESVARGEAVIDRFRLDSIDAEAVASRMGGGDGWIARDEVFISAAARRSMDGIGGARDGKISEREMALALGRGNLAITRDGVYLADEVPSPSRPVPPPIDPRPVPPPIDPHPVPPPIDPRPVPPPIHPYPPSHRSPAEILSRFRLELLDLKAAYNSTPMTSDTFRRLERRLFQQAAEDLIGAVGYPFAERNMGLKAVYNSTSMTSDEFKGFERRLYFSEAEDILSHREQSYFDRILPLKALYNSTSMTSDEFKGFEHQLIEQEVDRIVFSHETLYDKLARLNRLYNASSMSASQRDAAVRRIEDSAFSRY